MSEIFHHGEFQNTHGHFWVFYFPNQSQPVRWQRAYYTGFTFQVTKPFGKGLERWKTKSYYKCDTLPLMLVYIICQWILINTRWHSDCFILNRQQRKWMTHADMQNAIYQCYGMVISLLKLSHLLIDENIFFHFKITTLPQLYKFTWT